MKKIFSILMVAFAMTVLVGCEPESPDNPSNGNSGAEMFVGTWHLEKMTVNGQYMTPQNVLLTMNEDGTGTANSNVVTENIGFTWSVEGDQLTITPQSGTHCVYTVNSLTENECTFSGNYILMTDIPAGNVVVHLVRAN